MRAVHGLARLEPGGNLKPFAFERWDLRPADLAVQVTHCGVCHSDLSALGSATAGRLPLVPGHEFTGIVTAAGAEVTTFAVGDQVAVGNVIDSCGECVNCRAGSQRVQSGRVGACSHRHSAE